MSNNRSNRQSSESSDPPLNQENDSLLNYSRQELIEMAKNLASGKYEKDSRQRDKIMQQLVKLLSEPDTPNSTG